MDNNQIELEDSSIIKMRPTQIVKIAVGDLSAPVATGTELSKLAVIEKEIIMDLLSHSERVNDKLILDPNALYWIKEYRMLLKDIGDLTRGVQEKVIMKQMDVVGELYKKIIKDKPPEEIIKMVRDLSKNV